MAHRMDCEAEETPEEGEARDVAAPVRQLTSAFQALKVADHIIHLAWIELEFWHPRMPRPDAFRERFGELCNWIASMEVTKARRFGEWALAPVAYRVTASAIGLNEDTTALDMRILGHPGPRHGRSRSSEKRRNDKARNEIPHEGTPADHGVVSDLPEDSWAVQAQGWHGIQTA
jgi:hypothetical protein